MDSKDTVKLTKAKGIRWFGNINIQVKKIYSKKIMNCYSQEKRSRGRLIIKWNDQAYGNLKGYGRDRMSERIRDTKQQRMVVEDPGKHGNL